MNQETSTPEISTLDGLLTIEELARKLRVKKSFLYQRTRLRGPDSIPCLRIGPRYIRFREQEVLQWLQDQQ
ncbi:MAG: helix-turn-helix domain-containing protein [Thermodesulfobacteriota bacterium]|nr:helix-turn-helix domain-containing protein [Thermodesulfobacteriota bacterium]